MQQGYPTSPLNFTSVQPAFQKFISSVPFWHPSVRPGVRLSLTILIYPSAKYKPCTCPHAKVIELPALHLLYHSTSFICFSVHIHEAPISLPQQTTLIYVITEASHMEPWTNIATLSLVNQFIFDFQNIVPLRINFPKTRVNWSEKSQIFYFEPLRFSWERDI